MRACLRTSAPVVALVALVLVFGWTAPGRAAEEAAEEPAAAAAEPAVEAPTDAVAAEGETPAPAEAPAPEAEAAAGEDEVADQAAAGEGAEATSAESEVTSVDSEATSVDSEADAAVESEDAALAEEAAAAPSPPASAAPHRVALGPMGRDDRGRVGRVHTVVRRDTLWDIADAYLGTPWVWPSIWEENPKVANPHLIYPGDRLWITPGEMRRVTDAEAESLLAAAPETDGPPAAIDATATDADADAAPSPPTMRVAIREETGIITEEQLEGAASVVDSPGARTWLGSMDDVFLGLGEGTVEVGDQFAVFRARKRVYKPHSGSPLGWHVDVLGWVEVKEVHEDVARAEVRMAYTEMRVGDWILPRERLPEEIELRTGPPGVEGRIVLMSDNRLKGSGEDIVYVDRGRADGLEVGSVLEVFRFVGEVREPARNESVKVPDRVLGQLVVVRTEEESATAIVRRASGELEIGDRVRGSEL